MKKRIIQYFLILGALYLTGCAKDLNLQPVNSNTADKQYSTAQGYKEVLAKVYGGYSLVSSTGVGNSDISVPGLGSDKGPSDFLRALFNVNELTTDEAVCAWNDADLQSLHNLNWASSNLYVNLLYARSLFQITVCNELIRESSDEKITARGFTGADADNIRHYRAEARFLRAYQYWVLMDVYGNPPFVTDKDPIGKFIPPQITRADLFTYIETELKAIDADLVPARQNEYARADQAAAWALLARMYLNAAVYTGQEHYTDAIAYANKVISAGYKLVPKYASLFQADNNLPANTEVILPIAYDASNSGNYGGTTFLICSAHTADAAECKAAGIPGGGWLGNRTTEKIPQLFADQSGKTDARAMFQGDKQAIDNVLTFTDGWRVNKFSNIASDGTIPYSPNGVLVNTDFPLFRLAEMYLIYAEAVKRGGAGGDAATALLYMNKLRERAYGNANGNFTSFTVDDVLSERGREMCWEMCRRTDLIRFGKFTGSTYLWPWKGGVKAGAGVDARFNLLPIPSSEIIANPHLHQNQGY
ncbi:RagB/SusD family nutrient uptake outer membrane protein [Chitinophaga parva]|uniref:RagB/SusD family nutrient uptake outer membrane protein n=1 Tax=Chitinophaga parva TaxID=2169414 RepID=A0A2T7BHW3_9BACT|nr:RagB/SusD family nutrient uptake outer membrane protein [Chitinophaga parva]PUZ25875.1 RagB/SusD family nutrient uptake outer membrane protein [Chitinophaga parva]